MINNLFKKPRIKNPKVEGLSAFAVGLFFLSTYIVPIIENINTPIFLSRKARKITFSRFFPNYIGIYYFLLFLCMVLIIFGLYKYFSSKEPWHYDPERKKALLIVAIFFTISTIIQFSLPIYSNIMRIAALTIIYFVIYKISRKE